MWRSQRDRCVGAPALAALLHTFLHRLHPAITAAQQCYHSVQQSLAEGIYVMTPGPGLCIEVGLARGCMHHVLSSLRALSTTREDRRVSAACSLEVAPACLLDSWKDRMRAAMAAKRGRLAGSGVRQACTRARRAFCVLSATSMSAVLGDWCLGGRKPAARVSDIKERQQRLAPCEGPMEGHRLQSMHGPLFIAARRSSRWGSVHFASPVTSPPSPT